MMGTNVKDTAFSYRQCAVLVHSKQGYELQSEEANQQYRQELHSLLNRIVATFPPPEKGKRLIFAALDGTAYMCIQEPPDQDHQEARRTSKLSLYVFSDNSSDVSELKPDISEECARIMQRICKEQNAASKCYYYSDIKRLVAAFMLVAQCMPKCIEQRLFFHAKANAELDEATFDKIDITTGSISYMELFSIFLEHLCQSSGFSQAKINQAAALSSEISKKNTFSIRDVLNFCGNPALLADTADKIHHRIPTVYPYIAMVCVSNGYHCELLYKGDSLPNALADDLAETYLETSSEASAIRIEHLFRLCSRLALSRKVMLHVRRFVRTPHSKTEFAIRAIYLDVLLGIQYDLDLAALENQHLCKELLTRIFLDKDSNDRPALEWLTQKTALDMASEEQTSSQTGPLDASMAARLFYLRIPCISSTNKQRALNDKELIKLCGNRESAVCSIMDLMDLGWEPTRALCNSKLYRKAVRQKTAIQRKKVRSELRASLRKSCHLFGELLSSYFRRRD